MEDIDSKNLEPSLPEVLHFSSHSLYTEDLDPEPVTEYGYHVLGVPPTLPVPIQLLSHQEDFPILHIYNIQTSLEAELLLQHQTLFFNKTPKRPSITLTFGKSVTKIDVFINKVKVAATVDSGAPFNVISTKLAKQIKMAPELP